MRDIRSQRRRGDNPRRPLRGGAGIVPSFPFSITSLSPSTVALGAPDTPVDVAGVDFQSGATVYVDGVIQTTSFQTAFLVRFTFPASLALVPGYKTVVVKRTTFTSNARLFGVLFPVPTLTAATLSGSTLSVTGTGFFATGTHARIDGSLDCPFTRLTATTGTVAIPQSVLDVPGTHNVRIFNDAPGGGTSAPINFEAKYQGSVLVSLSLTQQFTGRAAGPFIIEGDIAPTSVFYASSVVKVDSTVVSAVLIDINHLRITIPGSLLTTPGPHAITVTNPTTGGGGGVSNALSFLSFSPDFDALSITEVPQYFDGFDVTGHVNYIDANFVATFGGVDQPTEILDANNFIVHMTSAAIGVPGVTTVRLRDTISNATTNAKTVTVVGWDPTAIGATLRLWLDGTSLIDDGSGHANAWNDKSGGGRNITQPIPSKCPLIVASAPALNGQPVARFAGASQQCFDTGLTWLTAGAAGIINNTVYNAWVVAQFTAGSGGRAMGETNGYIVVCVSATNTIDAIDSGAFLATAKAPFNWLSGFPPFAFRQRKTDGFIRARVNRGAEVSTAHGASPGAFAPVRVFVGTAAVAGIFMTGDIACIIVANADLNTTHKALIDNMISAKYGLPFSTPGTAPKITSVFPNVATQYDLPFFFVVEDTGGSYTPLSTVNVGGTALATEYLSSTQLRARLPNIQTWTAGGRAISVSDVTGISAPTGITVFAYTPVAGPNLYTASIASTVQYNDALVGVVFTGLNFTGASVVYANGVACATTPGTATSITATIPATALYNLPGAIITIHDGAQVSNALEITLTPWSPLSIVALTGWFRADDVILGTGNSVAQWNDKSGKGRHLVQATAAKQPQRIASDARFNGAPSIDFDGVDDYMTGAGLASYFTNTVIVCEVVFRADTITGTGAITQPYNNNPVVASQGGNVGIALHTPPTVYGYSNDGAYKVATNAGIAAGQKVRARLTVLAGNMNVAIDGVNGTGIAIGTTTMGAQLLAVGSSNAYATWFYDGQIPEFFTTNLALPAQDSTCAANYFRALYATV